MAALQEEQREGQIGKAGTAVGCSLCPYCVPLLELEPSVTIQLLLLLLGHQRGRSSKWAQCGLFPRSLTDQHTG